MTTLGMNIRLAREREGLWQREAAERIDISQVHFSRIESGRVYPSIPTLLRIAKGLDTTASELLRGVEDNS